MFENPDNRMLFRKEIKFFVVLLFGLVEPLAKINVAAFVLPNNMEDSSVQLSWKAEQDTHLREQFEIYLIS